MNTPTIQPYLFFGGCCEEALALYQSALGAEIDMIMRYHESPEPPEPGSIPPGYEDKVMHASFRIGNTTLMASDGCGPSEGFAGFSLSFTAPDEGEARRCFDALAEGGSIAMPLSQTFWSPLFGMVKDRFGLCWMVSIPECSAS